MLPSNYLSSGTARMRAFMNSEKIVLDHGAGGLLSNQLITNTIVPRLHEVYLGKMEDSAILRIQAQQIAVTTDSFVIDPIFFDGGDIGKIAVCGTVNDLAVSGASPIYLTLAFVLEEGFLISSFEKILDSICAAAKEAMVHIVAGDTKVVRKGEVDKIFINTAGVGVFSDGSRALSVDLIREGDHIIVSGQLGNHSIHILSIREGLGFEQRIKSDCAPLNLMIKDVLDAFGSDLHCMRDITRGGLGTLVNEMAQAIHCGMELNEHDLPLLHETTMAADMLGVNPMYLANEGNVCIFADPTSSASVVERLHCHKYGEHAAIVGTVKRTTDNQVVMRTRDGEVTKVDFLYGAELPRLC
jgi:hydrogenase expression/formation protein HypE